MKGLLFAFLILLFALPAHAQTRPPSGGGSPNGLTNTGGGGGGGYGGGFGSASASAPIPHTPPAQFHYGYAHGVASDFDLTTFLPYDEAIKLGQAVLDYKPKTVAEAARETRAQKKLPD